MRCHSPRLGTRLLVAALARRLKPERHLKRGDPGRDPAVAGRLQSGRLPSASRRSGATCAVVFEDVLHLFPTDAGGTLQAFGAPSGRKPSLRPAPPWLTRTFELGRHGSSPFALCRVPGEPRSFGAPLAGFLGIPRLPSSCRRTGEGRPGPEGLTCCSAPATVLRTRPAGWNWCGAARSMSACAWGDRGGGAGPGRRAARAGRSGECRALLAVFTAVVIEVRRTTAAVPYHRRLGHQILQRIRFAARRRLR